MNQRPVQNSIEDFAVCAALTVMLLAMLAFIYLCVIALPSIPKGYSSSSGYSSSPSERPKPIPLGPRRLGKMWVAPYSDGSIRPGAHFQ